MNLEIETDMPVVFADKPLEFDEWFLINEDSLLIEFSETGADREFGFDFELGTEKEYDKYLENWELQK
jgi:hypothetical protein